MSNRFTPVIERSSHTGPTVKIGYNESFKVAAYLGDQKVEGIASLGFQSLQRLKDEVKQLQMYKIFGYKIKLQILVAECEAYGATDVWGGRILLFAGERNRLESAIRDAEKKRLHALKSISYKIGDPRGYGIYNGIDGHCVNFQLLFRYVISDTISSLFFSYADKDAIINLINNDSELRLEAEKNIPPNIHGIAYSYVSVESLAKKIRCITRAQFRSRVKRPGSRCTYQEKPPHSMENFRGLVKEGKSPITFNIESKNNILGSTQH